MLKISEQKPFFSYPRCYNCNETYCNDTHIQSVKCPKCGYTLMTLSSEEDIKKYMETISK